jgi:hypothetical protein
VTVAALYGVGNHTDKINPETIGTGLLFEWIFNIFTIMSTGFGKFAIISLILQIQGPNHHKKRYFLFFVGGSTMLFDVIQSILVWFQCTPIHKLWDVMAPGSCPNQTNILHVGVFQGSELHFV